MTRALAMTAGLAAVALAAAGCIPQGTYSCAASDACLHAGVQGTCEANGFCAFPDPACPSGRRYGEYAGAGFGGACVASTLVDAGRPDAPIADAALAPDGPDAPIADAALAPDGPIADAALAPDAPIADAAAGPDATPIADAAPDATTCGLPGLPCCTSGCDYGSCWGYCSCIAGPSAGFAHACLHLFDGTVACWGANTEHQLGAITPAAMGAAVVVAGIDGPRDYTLALGELHSCVSQWSDGTTYCWGDNSVGQLGDGFLADSSVPMAVTAAAPTFTEVVAGHAHTCGIAEADRAVWCWGANTSGELGPTVAGASSNVPVQVPGVVADDLTAGGHFTCAGTFADETVRCWGLNDHSQLGTDGASTPWSAEPVDTIIVGLNSVYAGGAHVCVEDDSGYLHCWGDNHDGQLGTDAVVGDTQTPQLFALYTGHYGVALGGRHTCVLDGRVRCWGDNASGQVGPGGGGPTPNLVLEWGAIDIASIIAGDAFTCATQTDGRILCWGANDQGQLGGGTLAASSATPVFTTFTCPVP